MAGGSGEGGAFLIQELRGQGGRGGFGVGPGEWEKTAFKNLSPWAVQFSCLEGACSLPQSRREAI